MPDPRRRLRVLVLDGDARQALPFMRAMKLAGHHVAVGCSSWMSPGYFSRYADRKYIWPAPETHPEEFFEAVLKRVRLGGYDVTLALSHYSSHIVAPRKTQLQPYTRVPLPDNQTFQKLADKAWTMAYCMEKGIPCPNTYFPDKEDIESIAGRVPYPAVIKPCFSVGAIGIHRCDTPDQLRQLYPLLAAKYGKMLIQEYIPAEGGIQFRADNFLDAGGKLHVSVVVAKPRFMPLTGGTSTVVYTINRPDVREYTRRFLEGVGWTGLADADYTLDPRDNTPKLLECNPRAPVGIKIGFDCGIDFSDLVLRLALGEPLPPCPAPKPGMVLRTLTGEILWYFAAGRIARRQTYPQFFRFIGPNIHYQEFRFDDPLPLLGFSLASARKYASRAARAAKFGGEFLSQTDRFSSLPNSAGAVTD